MTSQLTLDGATGSSSAPCSTWTSSVIQHYYQQEQEQENAFPRESDVLPAYEGRCPVDPNQDSNEAQGQATDSRDTITIGAEHGDNVGGNWFIISQLGEGTFGEYALIVGLCYFDINESVQSWTCRHDKLILEPSKSDEGQVIDCLI